MSNLERACNIVRVPISYMIGLEQSADGDWITINYIDCGRGTPAQKVVPIDLFLCSDRDLPQTQIAWHGEEARARWAKEDEAKASGKTSPSA